MRMACNQLLADKQNKRGKVFSLQDGHKRIQSRTSASCLALAFDLLLFVTASCARCGQYRRCRRQASAPSPRFTSSHQRLQARRNKSCDISSLPSDPPSISASLRLSLSPTSLSFRPSLHFRCFRPGAVTYLFQSSFSSVCDAKQHSLILRVTSFVPSGHIISYIYIFHQLSFSANHHVPQGRTRDLGCRSQGLRR